MNKRKADTLEGYVIFPDNSRNYGKTAKARISYEIQGIEMAETEKLDDNRVVGKQQQGDFLKLQDKLVLLEVKACLTY